MSYRSLYRLALAALLALLASGCAAPSWNHIYPGHFAPVFSPSNAGQPCAATPFTMECQMRPDVIDPNL